MIGCHIYICEGIWPANADYIRGACGNVRNPTWQGNYEIHIALRSILDHMMRSRLVLAVG